ncbi:hypothetical protein LUZ60_002919 [Juncus effusus]|nr:hypothetical protein LUZ60_002919 [Juncus effusus]
MKFMKLGSKPDTFQSNGTDVRYVASDLPTDVVVHVNEVKFYLHKFPLLSKSAKLQRLVLQATESDSDEIFLPNFPGGPKSFDICAKFCYGMTVTLNPYNLVPVRCAAEFLEMSETVEKGNLIFKIEVFLNSSIFRSWKDTIIVLQSAKSQNLLGFCEELKIIGRCVDSIASKTSIEPCNVTWSYGSNKKMSSSSEIVESVRDRTGTVSKDWWIEDICELDIDLYKKVMIAIKNKGRMCGELIGEALRVYAVKWLPDKYEDLVSDDYLKKNKALIETIITLLPSEKGCSCRFLLKLLKISVLVQAGNVLKEELISKISSVLHKASVKDLLIPSVPEIGTKYDVALVIELVKRFVSLNGGVVEIGELVDGFLCEVAGDQNLEILGFVELATAVPEEARPVHDGLYTAIDIYLKEHQDITKSDKKLLCSLMDVKKLSTQGSIHAAQNDRLPLRVVVQVLFFEQQRTPPPKSGKLNSIHEENVEDNQEPGIQIPDFKEVRKETKARNSVGVINRADRLLIPSRSRRIFDKLWVGKGNGNEGNGKGGSETSGSSQSPPVSAKNGGVQSRGSSRNRRYSVS